ncbi:MULTISPECIES: hypothetical protein [Photorhabdus]|nr:hypothetical protein [Photorhabdus asymbiotica]
MTGVSESSQQSSNLKDEGYKSLNMVISINIKSLKMNNQLF